MFDFGELQGKDIGLVRGAHAIVTVLNSREPGAHFAAAVDLAESTRAFSEILQRAVADGIEPGKFIAVHALGQCAIKLKECPPNDRFAALNEFLFDATGELLGPEIHDHLREWTDASHADGETLATAGKWAKLGAMTRSLKYIDLVDEFIDATAGENVDVSRAKAAHQAIAAACTGTGPSLDAYYRARLGIPGAPVAGAPGPK